MAFNVENLTIATNNVKAGGTPALYTYYNEANDNVFATSFFTIGRFTVGDILIVISNDGTTPMLCRVSAVLTTVGVTLGYATIIRHTTSNLNANPPEVVTAVASGSDVLKPGVLVSHLVTTAAVVTAVYVATVATDIITVTGIQPVDGQLCTVTTSSAAPAGLAVLTDYYVVSADGFTCKLSATLGGAAIDITDVGTGVQTLSLSDNAFTLADGAEGQRKVVKLKTDGAIDARVIPANLQDGTTIVFGTALEFVNLVFSGGKWNIIGNVGGVVA